MANILQVKTDTTTNWAATAKALASGQMGYDSDLSILRIGDGSTLWGSLPGFTPSQTTNIITRELVYTFGAGSIGNSKAFTSTILGTGFTVDTYFEVSMVGFTRTASNKLQLQTSSNNGSTYNSAGTSYEEGRMNVTSDQVQDSSSINVCTGGTTADSTTYFRIMHLFDANVPTIVDPAINWTDFSNQVYTRFGRRKAAVAENAFKLFLSSGNFTGPIRVWRCDVVSYGI